MNSMNAKDQSLGDLSEAGLKLVGHSKSVEFSARGKVVELFPYIFDASERMSARAISRYFDRELGIKISAVTVNKALKDPKKFWNLFFDTIEPAARYFEKSEKVAMKVFLFKEQYLLKPFKSSLINAALRTLVQAEYVEAVRVLRGKWYCIPKETRDKGRPFIESRLVSGYK
jgi:hypothetical protein